MSQHAERLPVSQPLLYCNELSVCQWALPLSPLTGKTTACHKLITDIRITWNCIIDININNSVPSSLQNTSAATFQNPTKLLRHFKPGRLQGSSHRKTTIMLTALRRLQYLAVNVTEQKSSSDYAPRYETWDVTMTLQDSVVLKTWSPEIPKVQTPWPLSMRRDKLTQK
jgi:hypothetical protein